MIRKKILLAFVLLGCSGEPFKESESKVEQGNYQAASGGGGSEDQTSGGEASQPQPSAGSGGQSSIAVGGRASAAGSGGAAAMAGGPAMGEGGAGGVPEGPRSCLANWQALDCARVCTNSQSDCQAVINCWVSKDSLDGCDQFTSIGISYAQSAYQGCCNHG